MIDRSNNIQTLSTGTAVMTKDGARLGSVKEVTAKCFKVDAPFHKDYWLSNDLVETTNDTGIVLELTAASVAEHEMDRPELMPDEDPFDTMPAEPIISDEELLEQRAKMERELAEQSRALPEHEPSVTQIRGARAYERIPADHTGFGNLAGEYVPNAPVLDERMAAAQPQGGSAMSRVAMFAAPILLSSATAIGTVMLVRRMRRRKTETLPAHARRVVEGSAKELGTLAQDRASAMAHAAKPKLKSTAGVGKERTRKLIHDGLVFAAKQFE